MTENPAREGPDEESENAARDSNRGSEMQDILDRLDRKSVRQPERVFKKAAREEATGEIERSAPSKESSDS